MENTRLGSCWRLSLWCFLFSLCLSWSVLGKYPQTLTIVKTLSSLLSRKQRGIQLPLYYTHIARQLSFFITYHVYNSSKTVWHQTISGETNIITEIFPYCLFLCEHFNNFNIVARSHTGCGITNTREMYLHFHFLLKYSSM